MFFTCRRIVIPSSAFDSKAKFLENARKSFGGGSFTLHESGRLGDFYSFLKEEYRQGNIRQYFPASSIGLQLKGKGYWCLSREVRFKEGAFIDDWHLCLVSSKH